MKRQSGSLLVEVLIALTIFTVAILSFFASFHSIVRSGEEVQSRDRVQVVLKNLAARLRDSAFDEIYKNYNATNISTTELADLNGGPARVRITCFVDETSLPSEFGPVLDLDGSGGLDNADCSTTYRLLPVCLAVTYATDHGSETRQVFAVISGNM